MINTQNKPYKMLSSIERIIENVDKEIQLVNTFEIKSFVRGFLATYNLEKFWMSVMKTRGPSNEKTVRHVPKYVSK